MIKFGTHAWGTISQSIGSSLYGHHMWLLTILLVTFMSIMQSGLSLRAGGRGFSPATNKRVAPGYFYWKIEEK